MPIQDVNALLAQPWPNLAAQWADQVNEGLRNSQIATDSGPGGTIHYDARIQWDDDLEVVTDLTAVPGYARMDASGLRFAAPLDANASYSMRADGTLSGHIKVSGSACKLADQTLTHEPQTIALTGLRLVVDAALDSSDPDWPKLKSVNLAPNALLTLTGYVAATLKLSQLEPVVTRSGPNAGARSWQVTVSDVRIKAVRNARLSGTLTLTLEPTVTLDFRGTLRFGQIGIPFNGHKIVSLPTPLADVLALLGREGLPRDWGQNPPHPVPAPPTTENFRQRASELEQSTQAHAPFGTIYDFVYDPNYIHSPQFQPCDQTPPDPIAYAGAGDSAIWTGHFLAAEAFKWAAAAGSERTAALTQIARLLDGIETLLAVPGHYVGRRGLLCRAVLPDTSPIEAEDSFKNPPPFKRDNFYTEPVAFGDRNWVGKGRNDDPPSRDSYTGILLGLGMTVKLVDDAAILTRARALVTDILGYVLDNDWNLPTPTDLHVPPHETKIVTTWIHQFPQQLAWLRLGKTVEGATPGRFSAAYDSASRAADWAWLSVWADCLDPVAKYYKFNLLHAHLGLLLLLETDASLRANYQRALRILRRTVGHHRNAYFNLWWILADPVHADAQAEGSPGGVTVKVETRALLSEWLLRRTRVAGPRCLPLEKTPDLTYLTNLHSQTDVQPYRELGQTNTSWLSLSALPVQKRPGQDMDFVWQRAPFLTALDYSHAPPAPTESPAAIRLRESTEAPGIDFLLAVWMAAHLNIV